MHALIVRCRKVADSWDMHDLHICTVYTFHLHWPMRLLLNMQIEQLMTRDQVIVPVHSVVTFEAVVVVLSCQCYFCVCCV